MRAPEYWGALWRSAVAVTKHLYLCIDPDRWSNVESLRCSAVQLEAAIERAPDDALRSVVVTGDPSINVLGAMCRRVAAKPRRRPEYFLVGIDASIVRECDERGWFPSADHLLFEFDYKSVRPVVSSPFWHRTVTEPTVRCLSLHPTTYTWCDRHCAVRIRVDGHNPRNAWEFAVRGGGTDGVHVYAERWLPPYFDDDSAWIADAVRDVCGCAASSKTVQFHCTLSVPYHSHPTHPISDGVIGWIEALLTVRRRCDGLRVRLYVDGAGPIKNTWSFFAAHCLEPIRAAFGDVLDRRVLCVAPLPPGDRLF
jgi:hypothetical protein